MNMDAQVLIDCFDDTMAKSLSGRLRGKTSRAVRSCRVYKESFTAKRRKLTRTKADIIVEKNTSFAAASKYLEHGRTAVLNFANPVQAGGGVGRGAMAQEECLCRSSNLYACISSERVSVDFYNYHIDNDNDMNSDRLIYTSGVTVFKSDDAVPLMLDRKQWYEVDVITCAAPYLGGIDCIDVINLKRIIRNRVRNIFEAAIDNKVSVIILGAFGCGAFYNPPELVAEAFREIIIEEHYRDFFKKIVFAIKADDEKGRYNYETFDAELGMSGRLAEFYGKRFSIFGDSISTLEGYNPDGYEVFYNSTLAKQQGINSPSDTWWGMVIDYLGGSLLVNNSWSGSRVSQSDSDGSDVSAGCSDLRTKNLHTDKGTPDYIIIYMGFNDWGCGVDVGWPEFATNDPEPRCFADSYRRMLVMIRNNYPNAKIYCCTLCKTYMNSDSSFIFPDSFGGVNIEEYNRAIRYVCMDANCELLDLYSCDIPYDAIDGTHPTKDGMRTLARLVVKEIGSPTIDCSNSPLTALHISSCRHEINLEGNRLTWRNCITPTEVPAFEKCPRSFFQKKTRILSEQDYKRINNYVKRLDFSAMKKANVGGKEYDIGVSFPKFRCEFSNGIVCDYAFSDCEEFDGVLKLLESYCEFEEWNVYGRV